MAYYPPYDMALRPSDLSCGKEGAQEALNDVIHSMVAITAMMRALLEAGEDQRHLSEHVYRLLDQQCCMLASIEHEWGEEEAAKRIAAGNLKEWHGHKDVPTEHIHKLRMDFIETNAKAGVEPDLISAVLNIKKEDIERVIRRLRGEKPFTATQGPKGAAANPRASAQA